MPVLPPAVAEKVRAYAGPRHPVLAQGRLQGHWPDGQQIQVHNGNAAEYKQAEAQRQATNIANYFKAGTHNRIVSEALHQRQEELTKAVGRAVSVRLALRSRLSIGFGLPNALETGLLLHPLYGIPYLPGSAIKGITQSYLLLSWAEGAGLPRLDPWQTEKWNTLKLGPLPLARFEALLLNTTPTTVQRNLVELQDKLQQWWTELGIAANVQDTRRQQLARWCGADNRNLRGWGLFYTACFGRQTKQGQVTFLDALPHPDTLRVCVDVLTPHYQGYYTSLQAALAGTSTTPAAIVPPGDFHDPVPVPFLAVDRGTEFTIRLILHRTMQASLAERVLPAVQNALTQRGIGAKTSSGYGLFEAVT